MNERNPSTESNDTQRGEDRVATSGQFNILTLLSWTAVTCFLLVWTDAKSLGSNYFGTQSSGSEFLFLLVLFAIFIAPPFTCIPFLIDRLFSKQGGLNFSIFWRVWLLLCLAIYSVAMLILATSTFGEGADWKGCKGMHWSYYMLDKAAGTTLWPIYLVGAMAFVAMLFRPDIAKRNVLLFFGPAICAVISFWYTFASLCLNFSAIEFLDSDTFFAIVPGAAGICYTLYCVIIWKNREFTLDDFKASWRGISAWTTCLLVSIGIKIPLAMKIYDDLPDEMPDHCFVVTAATKGHRNVVHTWFDVDGDRILNQQLLTFWKFEHLLKLHTPKSHWVIRRIYNWIGPIVARLIVFRWQADLAYLLLKPAEWIIRLGLRMRVR